jgi:hypothetical protein
LEAFLLYNYSNSDFIAWVRRRYAVYFTNRSLIVSVILGVACGLSLDMYGSLWRIPVILSVMAFVVMLWHNGGLPLKEIEHAEMLLCDKMLDHLLADVAAHPLAESLMIRSRGHSGDGRTTAEEEPLPAA